MQNVVVAKVYENGDKKTNYHHYKLALYFQNHIPINWTEDSEVIHVVRAYLKKKNLTLAGGCLNWLAGSVSQHGLLPQLMLNFDETGRLVSSSCPSC